MKIKFCMCLALSLFFLVNGAMAGKSELNLSMVSPSGENVPVGRQITFQFDKPMVPLGKMDRSKDKIPIEITPSLACHWRWLNKTVLACNLDEEDAFKEATKYEIRVLSNFTSMKGQKLKKERNFKFVTISPKVRYVSFDQWKSPHDPRLRIAFSQPVSRKSIINHIYILTGKEGEKPKRYQLNAERARYDKRNPRFVWSSDKGFFSDIGEQKILNENEEFIKYEEDVARQTWVVSSVDELPADSVLSLMIEPGLVSALGKQRGTERRLLKSFNTFPDFSFEGIRCLDNKGKDFVLNPNDSSSENLCDPMEAVHLLFSSPVIKEEVKKGLEFEPDLTGGREDYDPWSQVYGYSRLRSPHKQNKLYRVRLPSPIKAAQTYTVSGNLQDEFGRKLQGKINIRFSTDHRKPHFAIVHQQSVLEKEINSDLPVYVTNLEKIKLRYNRLTSAGTDENKTQVWSPGELQDIAYATPMKVREMLNGKSGVVYGQIESVPQDSSHHESERWFLSEVTPYQVLVKKGHFNTLVWVTDMKTGNQVADADVSIYKGAYTQFEENPLILSRTKTDSQGLATLKGSMTLDPDLNLSKYWQEDKDPRLIVQVTKDDSMAWIPLDKNFSIDTYRVSESLFSHSRQKYGHVLSWGTTAQGIYKAGDTIEYKVYVRDQDNQKLILAPSESYELNVIDPTGKKIFEKKGIQLSAFGTFDGEMSLSKNAAVGWYRFELKADFTKKNWQVLRVLVNDFTPSEFKVENSLNDHNFIEGDEVEVTTRASLHSGGPYTDAQARITASFVEKPFFLKDSIGTGFYFQTHKGVSKKKFFQQSVEMGDKGEQLTRFMAAGTDVIYGKMIVESSVMDDRGKYNSALVTAAYHGVDRMVGLKSKKWVFKEDEKSEVEYLVVDAAGNLESKVPVSLSVQRLNIKASRVKGSGNAYLTSYIREWMDVSTCSGLSQMQAASCSFTPDEPGSYRVVAKILDTQKREHKTTLNIWVAGKAQVLWEEGDDRRLKVVPESKEIYVGKKARYLVKNPFPGQKALISIERYGVIDSWVETFSTSTPIVEFEIKPEYLPGFYLSVTVVSPRVKDASELGELDLGKPSFRMGYVTVNVLDKHKELVVDTKTDKEIYKPRETVKVRIKAHPRKPASIEPMEIAVAVVDEAVFDLVHAGSDHYDPYKGFYRLGDMDVQNYSLLMRLIGRQKFEKKGASQGGDGGKTPFVMRDTFKYLAYWNPSIKTDSSGAAEFSFNLPDNLTGWRILTLAVTAGDRMGLGQKNFKVNLPTEIRAVMPNQVAEGDHFDANFSVMNRTDKPRDIEVTVNVKGDIKKESSQKRVLKVLPFKRQVISVPVETEMVAHGTEIKQGSVNFDILAKDDLDQDFLSHQVPVRKMRSLENAVNFGSSDAPFVLETIAVPKDIHPDSGKVGVVLTPTVIGQIQGAFEHMRDYPYECWEQKISKAIMAANSIKLKSYLSKDFLWESASVLPQETIDLAGDYQAPNGGMTYFLSLDNYVSPYLSAYTALAFGWLKESGYLVPLEVEKKLHAYLQNLLRRDVEPDFYSEGMSSTVRAVVLHALARAGKISKKDLRRSESNIKRMSLFGKSNYLMASLKLQEEKESIERLLQEILSYSNQSSGKMVFDERGDKGYSRLLASSVRTNCMALWALIEAEKNTGGKSGLSDLPYKIVRSITEGRESRNHFENTQENVFCANALIAYSQKYENNLQKLNVDVQLGDKSIGSGGFNSLEDDELIFKRKLDKKEFGKKQTLRISKKGDGRFYYSAHLSYAPLTVKTERINAGMELRREYHVKRKNEWVRVKKDSFLKRGDMVKVDLFLSVPASRNFVVVEDPLPGAFETINKDLKTASTTDLSIETGLSDDSWFYKFTDWKSFNESRWNFYHRELREDKVRFFADYLPAGRYRLSYSAQVIATGKFSVMPSVAKEMYDPDVFGKSQARQIIVRP